MAAFLGLSNYVASLFLVLLGLYTMLAACNLVRKVIGMVVLQTGVILFFISVSFKMGAAIPIVSDDAFHAAVNPANYANPLPHALMLTAIVVGVSTLGVALVLLISIYRSFRSIEENEILKQLEEKR